ncbi:helix-turn-helix domain-containing protein [Pseudonocardia xishanensis]|uniref:helix-turn-helix domain-containing protein n=1 Tax=Pseudonocardia xishanensis TaxID=630995 RepID=UPI0031EAAB90
MDTPVAGVTVEEAASLSSWAELIRARFIALQITPHGLPDLRGAVRSRHVGHMQAATVRSAPQTFQRTRPQATAADTDLLAVGMIEHGTGHLEQDGRRCVVSEGGFALYDTSRPFTWSLDGVWDMHVFTWPRSGLPFTDAELRRLTARPVSPCSPIGSLVTPMLHRFSGDDAPILSPSNAARLADEMAELTMIAASEPESETGRAANPDRGLFRQIREFVEDNLTDPRLSAEHIAGALFVSTRTLHRTFARHDLTAAGWIKLRRLEACRRALCSPSWNDTPISGIAAHYGIANASFFSREFTARFGMSPRTYRNTRMGRSGR